MKTVGETVEKEEEINRDEEKIKTGKTKKKLKVCMLHKKLCATIIYFKTKVILGYVN